MVTKIYTHIMDHEHFMHRCLELAQKGRGLVGSNPLVGSVLVREETIIAEGCYRGVGSDHAEVDMIKNCEQDIAPTDRLYVNLEPCCHTGKTPPCTEAIIESGIKNVIFGMHDPDERVSGKGIHQLIDNGIKVTGPVLRAQCERLNKGYISLRTKNRPYITLKRAQTREGLVANTDGTKLCITSEEQNKWSHMHLRSIHDAILVGVQTVITDNPQLTIRFTNHESRITNHQPLRIVLDPNLRIPVDARVVGEGSIVIIDKEIKKSRNQEIKKLEQKGCTVIPIPMINHHFEWDKLWTAFSTFHFPLSTLLVEGGPKTWDAFKKAGFIDEEVILLG